MSIIDIGKTARKALIKSSVSKIRILKTKPTSFTGTEINNPAMNGGVCCLGKVIFGGYIPFLRPKGRGMYPPNTINFRKNPKKFQPRRTGQSTCGGLALELYGGKKEIWALRL